MTIQEAISEAMKRPIADITKIMVVRKEKSADEGLFFSISDEGNLGLRSIDSNLDCEFVNLRIEDILSNDWEIKE